MYTRFAEIYDRLMADFDYGAWADYYLALIARAMSRAPMSVCECACGTGSIAVRVARRGIRVTGVDVSEDMLRQAQAKAREAGLQIPFVRQDMRQLSLHRPVDAILCPCDGVNYLLTERDLGQFFGAAHAHLVPGGALAFDVSTECKLRRQAETGLFFEDHDDLSYFFQNRWRESTHTVDMDLSFFLRQPSGLYQRFDEHQVQRAHSQSELVQALQSSGFSNIRVFGDGTMDPPGDCEARIHIIATKGAQHVQ